MDLRTTSTGVFWEGQSWNSHTLSTSHYDATEKTSLCRCIILQIRNISPTEMGKVVETSSFHQTLTNFTDQRYTWIDNPVSTNHGIKDLGIIYSSSLQWDLHYKNIISKAYKMFYVLRHTFTTPSHVARKRLYINLVRSHLVYCSPLWRPHLIKDIEIFERVQRRATKFILNNYHLDYISQLL